uniref:Chemosensory protein n=1 Tax=Dendrolimus houi TaxID=765132 RepID=A0A076E7F2_9NEOP|nr:chemosensory protein [Dendrolimus houi]
MKTVIVCLCVLVAVTVARPGDHYTDKYDKINIPEILNNRRLLIPYILCILDKGKCTAEGKELKSHIREAIVEDCAKCTNTQRSATETVIAHLVNYEPEYWNELKGKFDPSGIYTKNHEADLRKLKAH